MRIARWQPRPSNADSQGSGRVAAAVVLVAVVVSTTISLHAARHLETAWDEPIDHDIAVGLQHHPLSGEQPPLDCSQMRLPMYVNAAVFALTGRDDLVVMRAVSVAVAALTILATFALARSLFGSMVGALAAVLLAFSPYFLSFARIAMTEGDVFVACFMTLALWAFVALGRRPSSARWLACAVFTALAVGAKLHAVSLVLIYAVLSRTLPIRSAADGATAKAHRLVRHLLIAGVGLIILAALPGALAAGRLVLTPETARRVATVGWAALLAVWIAIVVLILRNRLLPARGRQAYVATISLAAVTFFALMPVHLIRPEIAREILRRGLRWDGAVPMAHLADHLRLYSGIVLIKLTVPLGIVTAAALLFAIFRAPQDPGWRLPAVAVAVHVAGLCLLPLRQTFYLMAVYPLIMVLTAAFVVHTGRRLRAWDTRVAAAWSVLVGVMILHLFVAVGRIHPDYHLYGYAVVGDRWLGAESRGYRNLIQTPSDGVESLIRWCNRHAHPGDRVVSYLWEDPIIDRLLPTDPPYLLTRRGLSLNTDRIPPPPSIRDADYVLVHINNRLGYGGRAPDAPPDDLLAASFKPVYTFRRAGLDIAWVYGRRD